MDYFEAHEIWEELWSDYYLEDRKFIQGLIQLSVSFVHIGNGNLIGAKNLLKKSKNKFLEFSELTEALILKKLIKQIERCALDYENLENTDNFEGLGAQIGLIMVEILLFIKDFEFGSKVSS